MKPAFSFGYLSVATVPVPLENLPSVVVAFFPKRNNPANVIRIALLTREIQRGSRRLQFGPIKFKMATAMIVANGRIISREEMFDFLWGEREDGGPVDKCLDIHLTALRRQLRRGLDIDITTIWGRGWIVDLPALPNLALAA